MSVFLKAINIMKTYNSKYSITSALKNVSLDINKGEFVVILGKSGSGKTTLLNIIGGIMPPDYGEIILEDESLYALNDSKRADIRSRKIGYVYQDINLITQLSVIENIRLPFDIVGEKYDTKKEKEILDMLEIEDKKKFYPQFLSGGERQKVAIARALCKRPSLILADEPNGNLDSETGQTIMRYFKTINKEFNQTFIVVTHDENWLKYADTVYNICDGYINNYHNLNEAKK